MKHSTITIGFQATSETAAKAGVVQILSKLPDYITAEIDIYEEAEESHRYIWQQGELWKTK